MLFDAHLDLAFLVEKGRDMHAELDDCGGTLMPAAVTLRSLVGGGVTYCLGTVFTEALDPGEAPVGGAGSPDSFAYRAGDWAAARRAGLRQLMLYEAWRAGGAVRFFEEYTDTPITMGVLIEGADVIDGPGDVAFWAQRGVVAVGLTWAKRGRYACGNMVEPADDPGMTGEGRELVAALDEAGVVHDASHLSQKSIEQLFGTTDALIVASHSNCRQLFTTDGVAGKLTKKTQRHLSDESIAEIGRRGGVVGLNLVSSFLDQTIEFGKGRAKVSDCADHVEHVCEVMGHKEGVGLGTDMDGGIVATDLPSGIDTPSDLVKISDELRRRGWSDDEVAGFEFGNWARVFGVGS